MPPIRYLSVADVIALNADTLGHAGGLIDEGKLIGALGRAEMAAYYDQADLIAQITRLLVALAIAHAFADGNKRTAVRAAAAFWRLNGLTLIGSYEDLAHQVVALVAAQGNREAESEVLEEWLRDHIRPR